MASENKFVALHFPEEIIHGIQSFLPGKDAAETCLFSKSWHNAWSTRPVLFFDEQDFKKPCESNMYLFSDEFSDFVRKAIRRYQDLRLKIETLALCMVGISQTDALANEIVAHALELGVNELDLTFLNKIYALPAEVFATTSLTKLMLRLCRVNPLIQGALLCCPLVSLRLHNVHIDSDTIQNILRGCPSIKNLELVRCDGIYKLVVPNMHNLVEFLVEEANFCSIEFDSGLATHAGFCNLRIMSLERVCIDEKFFSEFSSIFPCIQKLTLKDLYFECNDIGISSNSLEFLSLNQGHNFKSAQLDVPNTCTVEFKGGYDCGYMDFSRRLRELESPCIELNCLMNVHQSCFKLGLWISVIETNTSPYGIFLESLGRHTVSWKNSQSFHDLVSDLLLRSRSNSNKRNIWTSVYSCAYSFLLLLQTLCLDHTHQNFLETINDVVCLIDSEQVRVEVFEENVMEWRNIDLDKLIETLLVRHNSYMKQFKFRFRWDGGTEDPDFIFFDEVSCLR